MNLLRKLSVASLALALSIAVGNVDVAVHAQGGSGLKKEPSTNSSSETEGTPREQFVADATADSAQKKESSSESQGVKTAKVTGIGGVFFKSTNNNKELAQWYQKNLGLKLEPWGGAALHWKDDKAEDTGVTAWLAAKKDTTLFSPSSSSFMINYRIDNMDAMIAQLKRNGVEIQKGPESYENGKFLWVMDPDGNKVELWEPKLWNEKNKQ
jgi:predicted enzyme related to lactoylglutathione lyase